MPYLGLLDVKNCFRIWDVSQPLMPLYLTKLILNNDTQEQLKNFSFRLDQNGKLQGEILTYSVTNESVPALDQTTTTATATSHHNQQQDESQHAASKGKRQRLGATRLFNRYIISCIDDEWEIVKEYEHKLTAQEAANFIDLINSSDNFLLGEDKMTIQWHDSGRYLPAILPYQKSGVFVFLAIFQLIIELTQFLSFPFSIKIPFNSTATGHLPAFLKIFQFDFPSDRAVGNVVLLAIISSFVVAYILLIAHYTKTSNVAKRDRIPIISSIILWAGSTVLVIPIVRVLSMGGACTFHYDTGKYMMDSFKSTECFTNIYWMLLSLSSLLLLIYIFAAIVSLPVDGDFSIYGERIVLSKFHFLSKKSLTFETFLLWFKIILTFMISFIGHTKKYRLFLIISSTTMSFLTLAISQTYPSFYEDIGNRLRFIFNFGILFTNIMAIALLANENNATFEITIAYLFGIPFVLIAAWFFTKSYSNSKLIHFLASLGKKSVVFLAGISFLILLLFPIVIIYGFMCAEEENGCLIGNKENGTFLIVFGIACGIFACAYYIAGYITGRKIKVFEFNFKLNFSWQRIPVHNENAVNDADDIVTSSDPSPNISFGNLNEFNNNNNNNHNHNFNHGLPIDNNIQLVVNLNDFNRKTGRTHWRRRHILFYLNITISIFFFIIAPFFFGSICVGNSSYCLNESIGFGFGLITVAFVILISIGIAYNIAAFYSHNNVVNQNSNRCNDLRSDEYIKKPRWLIVVSLCFNTFAVITMWLGLCGFDSSLNSNGICPAILHQSIVTKILFTVFLLISVFGLLFMMVKYLKLVRKSRGNSRRSNKNSNSNKNNRIDHETEFSDLQSADQHRRPMSWGKNHIKNNQNNNRNSVTRFMTSIKEKMTRYPSFLDDDADAENDNTAVDFDDSTADFVNTL